MEVINKKRVCVICHVSIKNGVYTNSSGPYRFLLEYFRHAEELLLIEQPLPGSENGYVQFKLFKKNILVKNLIFYWPLCGSNLYKLFSSSKTYLYLKLRDIFYIVIAIIWLRLRKYNLIISLECLNASIVNILLNKNVFRIYYIFDWSPHRYQNRLYNWLYLSLDRFSSYKSSMTWNVADSIREYKIKYLNYNDSLIREYRTVPYSYEVPRGFDRSFSVYDKNLIVFSGGLIEENGISLLIDSIEIIIKYNPNIKLLIIGGGEGEDAIKKLIYQKGISENIILTGFIVDEIEILRLQSNCAIGLAPYPNLEHSRKPFGDVIKVRMYFASGIPVISTDVIPVSKEILDYQLGLVSLNDTAEEFAKSCLKALGDEKLLIQMRKNVIMKSSFASWSNNFNNALS